MEVRRILENEDEQMGAVLERFGESAELCDRAELWQVGTIEVLWLPDAYMGAVICDGEVVWHRQVEPVDAARCPYPRIEKDGKGLCDGHFAELQTSGSEPVR